MSAFLFCFSSPSAEDEFVVGQLSAVASVTAIDFFIIELPIRFESQKFAGAATHHRRDIKAGYVIIFRSASVCYECDMIRPFSSTDGLIAFTCDADLMSPVSCS